MIKKLLLITSFISIFILTNFVFGKIGGGDITFKPGKARDVIFSHESHVKDIGLKCTDCHDSIYKTKEKNKRVTMAEMRKGLSCGVCHNGKKAFDVKGNCANCHKKE